MAVSTSPVKILLDLEIDLDNLSSEENYLSALIEATNILSISNPGDGRIEILQEEIKRIRSERKAVDPKFKTKKTTISAASLLGRSANKEPQKLLSASKKMVDRKRMVSSSLETIVSFIAEKLTSIESTLLEKQKLEKKNAESNRKVVENLGREKEESRLEQTTGFLTGAAKKILQPVQGVLSRIFKFITTLILAKVFINMLKWFGNPANEKKIDSLVKFFSANWGKLLSAYLVFGTGLGRFVQFLTKTVISGAIKLTALTAKLLAAKGVKGARGFARSFSGGRGNKLARGLQVVGTAGAVLGMGGMFQGLEEGGEVNGEKGVDKIPTMLTDGEFVMSKGAVQKFGVDTLQSMNAMGGGSGIPKMMDGVTYANEGGQIKKNYSYKLSGASKDLIGGDKKFLKAIEGLSARRDINPAQLLGLIASESGFNAQASNASGATGLIQFMPMVAERMGITTEDIGKMNRSDQVGLIDQYFSMNQLPNNPSAGQLYTNVFMPSLTNKGSDYEITREDDKYNNAYIYRENAGLDKNKDGIITIDEMGGRIFDKMNEFGIKDTTKKNKGFNLLNPLSWFSGQAQGAIDQAEKGEGLFGNSLTGRMLEKKRALAEAQGYNEGGLVGKGAVQQYGIDTMEGMNAAAGGTNIPVLMPDKKRKGFPGGGRPYAPTSNAGVVTDPEEIKAQEAYMLKFVNEERALQGKPPLTELTYAPGVELTKMRGPGPRTKETSDTFTDLDRGIETTSTSKTVDGKTTFGASMRQTTEEDRQKFFAENPHAAQLVNLKDQIELDNLGADISASAKMKGGGLVPAFAGGGLVSNSSSNLSNSISNFNGGGLVDWWNKGRNVRVPNENTTRFFGRNGLMADDAAQLTRSDKAFSQGTKGLKSLRPLKAFLDPKMRSTGPTPAIRQTFERPVRALRDLGAVKGGGLGLFLNELMNPAPLADGTLKGKEFNKGGYTGPMTTPNIKAPVGQPTMSAPKVTVLPSRESINNQSEGQYGSGVSKIPQFNVGSGSSRKKKQLGITV